MHIMEYQCVDLDPAFTLSHGDSKPLLETNDLAEACSFVYSRFKDTGTACAVFQPRAQGYREIYRHTNRHTKRHTKRAASGRFMR